METFALTTVTLKPLTHHISNPTPNSPPSFCSVSYSTLSRSPLPDDTKPFLNPDFAAKKPRFDMGIGFWAALILALSPLDANATMIENPAAVREPFRELNLAHSFPGYCDAVVGSGEELSGRFLVNVPEGLSKHVVSSKKAQANWYRKVLDAWREAKPPPKTPEEATRLVVQALKRHHKADVEGLLAFYGLPLPQALVELSPEVETSLPEGVKFELHTLPVDAKAIPDGDTLTVYVSTTDPRESSSVPRDVQVAAVQRSQARAEKNYAKADALHKRITDSGYRVLNVQNEEVLARKYRVRLRGIDAPESSMPYGKDAKEELVKLVQGKPLKILVYGEDRYGRCVGDVYCNGVFVQEVMLKKGFAWHYTAYDQRLQLENWEKEARAKRVGLWASSNPQKPWEYRKDKREGR